jgi:hypothetical protein
MAEPYNGTTMTGGDSLTEDLNVFYDVSLQNGSFVFLCYPPLEN